MRGFLLCFMALVICLTSFGVAEAKKPAPFRQTMLKAARESLKDGDIDRQTYRKIWLASLSARTMRQLETNVYSYAAQAGKAPPMSSGELAGFDWAALLDFLIEIMPFILDLFTADEQAYLQPALEVPAYDLACCGILRNAAQGARRLITAPVRRQWGKRAIMAVVPPLCENACSGGVCVA